MRSKEPVQRETKAELAVMGVAAMLGRDSPPQR